MTVTGTVTGGVTGSASFSRDRRYRYRLDRRWGQGPSIAWVMLNPSTADAHDDDPTIRRCLGFARRWGFEAMTVVNLFAWCSSEPQALRAVADPVGPRASRVLGDAVRGAEAVVAAWGNLSPAFRPRAAQVASMLPPEALTLGLTRLGQPLHPLYVPASTEPLRFELARSAPLLARGAR